MTAATNLAIAIDAMGGDIGLDTTLAAVMHSQTQHPDLLFYLVGDRARIQAHALYPKLNAATITLVDAPQIVDMDEKPSSVLRHKRDSSMWRAIELVNSGKAAACVSAGNTGALMASSRFILKMLPGIDRPAICATLPTMHGHVHWLDLGANIESKPEQLTQFAIMGSELSRAVDENAKPQVGLLNVGSEAIKGSDTVKEAGQLMEKAPIDYVGFVEGNDIFLRKGLDVVVCDGFVGNVALKTVEGVAKFIQNSLEREYKRSIFTKIAAIFSLPVLKNLKKRIDPRMYNGAFLLGLQGVVVKSHGNADAFAYANAINVAWLAASHGILDNIRTSLAEIQPTEVETAHL